jgi:hypothetical protein
MLKIHKQHNLDSRRRGFIALTAVILLATGILAFSLVALSAAVSYADMVAQKELRIQATLNAQACLETAELMAAKDYFISGTFLISQFGCEATFVNDGRGSVHIHVQAKLGMVGVIRTTTIQI